MMNSFFDLAINRRSIRVFSPEKIDRSILEKILFAGLVSPTSRNSKGCEFVVVEDKDTLEKLSKSRISGSQFLNNAGAAIIVCVDATKTTCPVEDASIAAITMQLQAEDLDIGSCWIQIHKREKENGESAENFVKYTLKIEQKYDVLCIIALGKKNEIKKPHDKEEFDFDKIHFEYFKTHK